MKPHVSRRTFMQTAIPTAAASTAAGLPAEAHAAKGGVAVDGTIFGKLTGARALALAVLREGVGCVFGIPGAQENELWDEFKEIGLDYLLVTHEFSAAGMADGYARATGKPGVLCVIPGPGLTNAMSGLGEALLDSVPIVCLVGDVARGEKYRPYQVHELANGDLARPVSKEVLEVKCAADIPMVVGHAFRVAMAGEPGPVTVIIPYNLLMEMHSYFAPPALSLPAPFDAAAFARALPLLANPRHRIGIYAGMGCMDVGHLLVDAAEMLQAPVATTVSGKGVIDERHPLAVGWGYGPQAASAAEQVFNDVDVVLAIGARYSEVSTGFYSQPDKKAQIHVDINEKNLGAVMKTDVCVHADAGLFLARLLGHRAQLKRCHDETLRRRIALFKSEDRKRYHQYHAECGVDPAALINALRCALPDDALLYVDVTLVEHWAAEMYDVRQPRTYFNPTDNQSMGWSIPAALGGQSAFPGRPVATITGDGCFLMAAMELSTAARARLPIKCFVLDDQRYQYMQSLQKEAYGRTTATILANLDYVGLAKGLGVGYDEIRHCGEAPAVVRRAMAAPGPMLVRVETDSRTRPCRWIKAVRQRFIREMSIGQTVRFASRLGARAFNMKPEFDD